MINSLKSRLIMIIAMGLLFVSLVGLLVTISSSHKVKAASSTCHVVLSLDISGSIVDVWPTFVGQVNSLFNRIDDDGTAINRSDVDIAFWTFSDTNPPANINQYSSPNYVNSAALPGDPTLNQFQSALNGVQVDRGLTNYAQGFGYNPVRTGISNSNFTMVPNNSINNLRHPDGGDPNLVILLTDGEPNSPGAIDPDHPSELPYNGDANDAAIAAAQAAKGEYPSSTAFAAGFINNNSARALDNLKKVIPADPAFPYNVGPLSVTPGSGDSLSQFINNNIDQYCGPTTAQDYSLTPSVTRQGGTNVESGGSTSYSYNIASDSTSTTDGQSPWQIYNVTVAPNVSAGKLNFSDSATTACPATRGKGYCDYGAAALPTLCNQIYSMLGGQSANTCNLDPKIAGESLNGSTSSIPPGGQTDPYGRIRTIPIDDLPLGTKVCSIIALSRPVSGSSVTRISSAQCVTVAKTPLAQVQGGDIRVGRHFVDDGLAFDNDAGVYTSSFRKSADAAVIPSGSRTYGSWGEYGVIAPGPIRSIASLSGYAGPHGGSDAATSGDTCNRNTNKLTFTNSGSGSAFSDECGHATKDGELIPDLISSLTSNEPLNSSTYPTPLHFDDTSAYGRYEYNSDGATVDIAGGDNVIAKDPLGQNRPYIVYVPNGTVTISDNIRYKDTDAYANIGEIPQLIIIAKNINIKASVQQVDAWMIAKAVGGNGGVINTCVNYVTPTIPTFSAPACSTPLRINGPVMANELLLWRTKVDLSNPSCKIAAVSDCDSNGDDPAGNTPGDPAEIINLPGTSLLWAENYNILSSRAETTYTIELPPYY